MLMACSRYPAPQLQKPLFTPPEVQFGNGFKKVPDLNDVILGMALEGAHPVVNNMPSLVDTFQSAHAPTLVEKVVAQAPPIFSVFRDLFSSFVSKPVSNLLKK
jgi:hypothetical protein